MIYCARGGSVSNKVLDVLPDMKPQARFIAGAGSQGTAGCPFAPLNVVVTLRSK
jgi:hypothetical protein